MRRLLTLLISAMLLVSCSFDPIQLDLAAGWKVKSLMAWRNTNPQTIAPSKDGKWLYISIENSAGLSSPSLASIDMESGRHQTLLSGLHRAHGLKIAPDTSLWIGEQFDKGMIWRITEPNLLPNDQRIDRDSPFSSHPAITPLPDAGRFTHSDFAFSIDGRFAYMSGADQQGRLYRYELRSRSLQVLHEQQGWLVITNPESAEAEASKLGARAFNPLGGVTVLPDGLILIADPSQAQIFQLNDRGASPKLSTYLKDEQLNQPENLVWDNARQWLWISGGIKPSHLWAYHGDRLNRIATHKKARITGISIHSETLFLNLRDNAPGPEITLQLTETDGR